MRLAARYAEHAQQVLGHPVGGLLDVAGRLVVQQLAQRDERTGSDRDGNVDIGHVESSGVDGGCDVTSSAGRQAVLGDEKSGKVVEQDAAEFGFAPVEAPGEPEGTGENLGGVLDARGDLVEQLAVGVHHRLEGSLVELFLGLEVVVERPHEGFHRSWGIGRHIEGSQIFDYWRDPDGLLVEHFTDGDRFDCTLEPGWSPMTASGLAQWGPPASKDFMGIAPGRESLRELTSMVTALRDDNEFDVSRLRGMLKMATS